MLKAFLCVLILGLTLTTDAAKAAPLLCEKAHSKTALNPKKVSRVSQKTIDDFWTAQNYGFHRLARLTDTYSDPRITQLKFGVMSTHIFKDQMMLQSISPEKIEKTRSEWEPYLKAREDEWNRHVRITETSPGLDHPYVFKNMDLSFEKPIDIQETKLLPKEFIKKYPNLFSDAVHVIPGQSKPEQSVHTAYKSVFYFLREWVLSGEGQKLLGLNDLEWRWLRKIYANGHEISPIEMLKEDQGAFDLTPDSPHRLAITGNKPGEPIQFNHTLLEKLLNEGQMSLPDLMGLMIHELGHHLGVKDTAGRPLDQLGAKVTAAIKRQYEQKIITLPDGPQIKLHMFKTITKPRRFRDTFDKDGLVLIFDDGAALLDISSLVLNHFKSNNMMDFYSLVTLKDFDVEPEFWKPRFEQDSRATKQSILLKINILASRVWLNPDAYFTGPNRNQDAGDIEKLEEFVKKNAGTNSPYAKTQYFEVPVELRLTLDRNTPGKTKVWKTAERPWVQSSLDIPYPVPTGGLTADLAQVKNLWAEDIDLKKNPRATFAIDLDIPKELKPMAIQSTVMFSGASAFFSLPNQDVGFFTGQLQKVADGKWRAHFTSKLDPGLIDQLYRVQEVKLQYEDGSMEALKMPQKKEFHIYGGIKRPPLELSNAELIGGKPHHLWPAREVGNEVVQLRFRVKNAVQPMEFYLQLSTLMQTDNQPLRTQSMIIDLNKISAGKSRNNFNPELITGVYFKKISESETEFVLTLDIREGTLGHDLKQLRLHSIYIRDYALRQEHIPLGPMFYIYPTGAYPKQ